MSMAALGELYKLICCCLEVISRLVGGPRGERGAEVGRGLITPRGTWLKQGVDDLLCLPLLK